MSCDIPADSDLFCDRVEKEVLLMRSYHIFGTYTSLENNYKNRNDVLHTKSPFVKRLTKGDLSLENASLAPSCLSTTTIALITGILYFLRVK